MSTTIGGMTVGTEPFPSSIAGTTLAGGGSAFSDINAQFAKIVTVLVRKQAFEILRKKAVILQDSAWIPARNVPGTNKFVYVAYADLGAAEDISEGVPPVTVPLVFDTMDFMGSQKGKIVAISDLAELFNPFDQYAVAAEKVA